MKQIEIRITASDRIVMVSIGAVTFKIDLKEIDENLFVIESLVKAIQKILNLKIEALDDIDKVKDYIEYMNLWLGKDFVCDATFIIYEDGKMFMESNGKNTINIPAIISMLSRIEEKDNCL